MLDEYAHDASHSTRALVAEALDERRVEIADDIVTRLRKGHDLTASPLIVRTLVHTLAKSLADGSPDPVVHWARMVRHAHSVVAVTAMIDSACAAAEELAHSFHGDLATIVVFLEIAKARSHAATTDEPGRAMLRATPRSRDSSRCSALATTPRAATLKRRANGLAASRNAWVYRRQ